MSPRTLVISELKKSFGGVEALRGANLRCEGGETHALIGENGAGKSTLVKVLSGAVGADSGEVLLDGERLRAARRWRRARPGSRRCSRSSA